MPSTRSYHQLCPKSVDKIGYNKVSNDNDLAGTFTFNKAVNPKQVLKQFLPMNMLHVFMTVTDGSDGCRM